ncbi:MAG: PAS domain S-box protein, partial [Smithella sp.]
MNDQSKTKHARSQKRTSLNEALEYAGSIINTVHEPLIVLDHDLRVITASRSFYEFFKVKPGETEGQLIYDLGDKQWDIPKLRELLEIILPQKTTFDNYEVEHDFATIGRRTMLLHARQIKRASGKERIILLSIEDITENKRVELEVSRANENNFFNIFDNAADGILIADIGSKKFHSGNPAICRMLGYSLEEIKNLGVMDIHPEKDIPYIIDHFEKMVKGEITLSENLPVKRKDGTVIYADVNSTTITFSGKTYILGFFHDNTGRRQAEAQREEVLNLLRKSEKYFKEITENSSDIIIITDKNGDIKYCSRSVERFTGYKPEEITGRSGFSLIHPDDVERAVVDYGKAILVKESAIPNAFRIVCKDGSERCLEGLGKNLLDNPDVAGFIMNVRDITERRQAEEELRESEEKYRTILENMQEAYYELDLAGNFTFVNNTVCRHMGYSKDELIGMNYRHYTDKEDLQRVFQAYSKVYLTGEPFEDFAWHIIKKDGTKMYIEGSASLRKDSSGKPIGFKGIDHDITDRKKAEEELRQSEEKYRTILENIEDGYYEVDLAGNFTFFNDSFCRILGYSKQEMLGMNDRQYADKETSKKVFQAFNKV